MIQILNIYLFQFLFIRTLPLILFNVDMQLYIGCLNPKQLELELMLMILIIMSERLNFIQHNKAIAYYYTALILVQI